MDARARDYVRTDQKLLASDMIFSNGSELTEAAVASIDKASTAETLARTAAAETFERRRSFALVAAAAAAGPGHAAPAAEGRGGPALSGVPRAERAASRAGCCPREEGGRTDRGSEERRGAAYRCHARGGHPSAVLQPAETTPAANGEPVPATGTAAAPGLPPLDFKAVAALCTELSRVDDTHGAAAAPRARRVAARRGRHHPLDCRSRRVAS